MIRQVRGTVITVGSNFLIIEVGNAGAGIGLRIFSPEATAARFRAGDDISLHTHLQVREIELSLYGFEELDELEIFEALLGVSGIGPKVALATLSTLTPDALRLAVANKEPGIVARVPGIGKRTAEKVIVELKDKLAPAEGELAALATTLDADAEVMEALTSLGYSVVEAQRALQQIPDDITGVEERLRMALVQFSD
ncbi:MAG: Holliday junction branch migration protein RuvA [Caldilineaceae bacterium]|nr:Holliday junction branch migration protein RuvA [Caldilineaceae bacterium]